MENNVKLEDFQINRFRYELTRRIVKFSFQKKDGTIREANGTTNSKYIPCIEPVITESNKLDEKPKKNKVKVTPKNIIVYYDIDKAAFRSFRDTQLITWEV